MKNGIFRALLLGIVASASLSLTQAASLAATSPEQTTKADTLLIGPDQEVAPAEQLARILENPELTDRFLLLGGV